MLSSENRDKLGKDLWKECNKYWFAGQENRHLIAWEDLAGECQEIYKRLAEKVVVTHEQIKNATKKRMD